MKTVIALLSTIFLLAVPVTAHSNPFLLQKCLVFGARPTAQPSWNSVPTLI
ncbi:hypothetical protein AAFX91_02110 [Bradyrhizobium sp. 31Argb]|uniref:hypothetical protein n=1 Tax=Bradyrhizobium sp. 31Argb TaxID=3141247 RepID=UPI003747A803